jgi:hypothetical protein
MTEVRSLQCLSILSLLEEMSLSQDDYLLIIDTAIGNLTLEKLKTGEEEIEDSIEITKCDHLKKLYESVAPKEILKMLYECCFETYDWRYKHLEVSCGKFEIGFRVEPDFEDYDLKRVSVGCVWDKGHIIGALRHSEKFSWAPWEIKDTPELIEIEPLIIFLAEQSLNIL